MARKKPIAYPGNANVTRDSTSVPLDTQDMLDAGAPTWNDHYVCIMRKEHARYQKDYIKRALYDSASGTHDSVDGDWMESILLLLGGSKTGWKQNCVWYDFFFVMTRGVRSTRPE